ncbi:insulin-like growth factor-binding protein 1 [Podarcis muralis]|uniref:Insulin-like growth factor-binding protein 1 n=1 Tax=Podarcis muralis TaxID=64176 RepID=A0A670JTZ2_PODMU|nr:insulin-like growth factor-binding protein 1 [Podarcis muralis]
MCSTGLRGELLLLLLCPGLILGAALQPMHCAPCTEEELVLCPPVPASCPETAHPPGCGCCHTCALQLGEPCGVYTARCGRGLRCSVPPEEPRPLHALLHGQGTCLPASDTAEAAESLEAEDMPHEDRDMTADQQDNTQLTFAAGQDKPVPWNSAAAHESMKARRLNELKKLKKQAPCKKELYKALEKLTKDQQRIGGEIYRFYLPNCNRNGFYHSKQCETSLDRSPAKCWCVYPKDGSRIPGSIEVTGNPECEQYFDSQE